VGFWSYYLAFIVLAWLLRYPWLLAGILVFFALRRFIPDPVVWAKTANRMATLRSEIDANPANVTARRDLARTYLERRRPRRALTLLDQARERRPDDAELLFLTGLARERAGDHEGALEPLVRAVEENPKVGYGEAYRAAGDALMALGRHEEAEDAYERFTDWNTSAVAGWVKLARARRKRGDGAGAKAALDEAFRTFRLLPGFQRRKQLGWWLRAQVAKLVT